LLRGFFSLGLKLVRCWITMVGVSLTGLTDSKYLKNGNYQHA
jgi:hypothetical protein